MNKRGPRLRRKSAFHLPTPSRLDVDRLRRPHRRRHGGRAVLGSNLRYRRYSPARVEHRAERAAGLHRSRHSYLLDGRDDVRQGRHHSACLDRDRVRVRVHFRRSRLLLHQPGSTQVLGPML